MNAGSERCRGLQGELLAERQALLRFLKARGVGEAAEDLLQDLWVKAGSVEAGTLSHPLAYLYRMADNLVTARARSELRRHQRETAWTNAVHGTGAVTADLGSGERSMIARQQIDSVEALLAELGDRTYRIFRRSRLDGIPHAQVADEMGVSLSTVEKHLRRAYLALARHKETLRG